MCSCAVSYDRVSLARENHTEEPAYLNFVARSCVINCCSLELSSAQVHCVWHRRGLVPLTCHLLVLAISTLLQRYGPFGYRCNWWRSCGSRDRRTSEVRHQVRQDGSLSIGSLAEVITKPLDAGGADWFLLQNQLTTISDVRLRKIHETVCPQRLMQHGTFLSLRLDWSITEELDRRHASSRSSINAHRAIWL